MPQLDTVTFFSQFFWLSFFFFGFYIALVKFYLPRISRILKLRSLKMSSSQGNFSDLQQKNRLLCENGDDLVRRALHNSNSLCTESFKNSTHWLTTTLETTNKNRFKKMNTMYLKTLGEIQVFQSILFLHLKKVTAPKSYTISGLNLLFASSHPSKEKMYNFKLLENITK